MGSMTIGELYVAVTDAIGQANTLFDAGQDPAPAYLEVSLLEEEIAKLLPAGTPEGALARSGAIGAAILANEPERAERLTLRYEGAPIFALDEKQEWRETWK